jgi:Mn2+/Fe2+ NRAMP family transporter
MLGPGIITAALVFGPSKITITSKLGADYSFTLLWTVVIAIFFMGVFTAMSGRIGIASDHSFLELIRRKWGKGVSVATGIGVFLVTASFQSGNAAGIGIASAELTHTSPVPWIIGFNIMGIGLLFFRSFYKMLEKLMILLVILMLFSFLVTFFLSDPPLIKVTEGFVPKVPSGSTGLIIALIASCFSIVGASYQSYLVQERRRINPHVKQSSMDSIPGILILGVMSVVVLICGAMILYPQHIAVNSGSDMAKALEPLYGKYAASLFLCGLFGASFSAMVGNASLGGTLMGDALGWGKNFNSRMNRVLIALIMILGATIAIVFGKLPIQLMIFAQSITILVVPFIGVALYLIANDEHIMGSHKNSIVVKIAGALGLVLLGTLALKNIQNLFF